MPNTLSLTESASGSNADNIEKVIGCESPSDIPSQRQPVPVKPKEGGAKAWLTVAGSAAGMFASFGWVNCIGLFQAEYETNQLKGYSSSDVAWITSLECKSVVLNSGTLHKPHKVLTY